MGPETVATEVSVHDENPANSLSEVESSIWTADTPPETVGTDLPNHEDHPSFDTDSNSSSVPWPGSTFIISDMSSGQVVTLRGGKITLGPIGAPGHGSIHWECVSEGGWIGFRDPVSGKYMGHDGQGVLSCTASGFEGFEQFCVRMKPDGSYVLFLTHHRDLWPVCVRTDGVLEKQKRDEAGGVAWKFVRV